MEFVVPVYMAGASEPSRWSHVYGNLTGPILEFSRAGYHDLWLLYSVRVCVTLAGDGADDSSQCLVTGGSTL
eukprot:8716423-Pyramimonas_sp.AAC.1